MERPYLVLWFAIALFLVLGVWGVYNHFQPAPAPPSAAQNEPTTQPPLVERPPGPSASGGWPNANGMCRRRLPLRLRYSTSRMSLIPNHAADVPSTMRRDILSAYVLTARAS